MSQSLEVAQKKVNELEIENQYLTTERETLRAQVDQLNSLLKKADDKDKQSITQIQNLGNRLNSALAKAASEERKRRKLEESPRNQIQQMNEELDNALNNGISSVDLGALRPKTRPTGVESQDPETPVVDELAAVQSLEFSMKDAENFRNAVQACWIVDEGSLVSKVTVTVAMSMTPDGKVKSGSLRLVSGEGGSDRAKKIAFEAARRAILRCQKQGYELPKDKYEYWKEMQMTFRP